MCSRGKRLHASLLALMLSAGVAVHAQEAATAPAAAASGAPATVSEAPAAAPAATSNGPTAQQVQAAASQVAQDPDLGKRTKQRKLQLRPDDDPKKPPPPDTTSMQWLVDLVRWLGESARMLVWLAGAVAVAFLLVGLRHWVRVRAESRMPPRPTLPSHVQSLDIRPESLPDRIGAAAAAMWTSGDTRGALSLLYRGALSRLVHDHAVPIRGASTEGECVQLAEQRLDAPRSAFFAKLVRAWQLAVYGSRLPADEEALALCRDFDEQLGARTVAGVAA